MGCRPKSERLLPALGLHVSSGLQAGGNKLDRIECIHVCLHPTASYIVHPHVIA